MSEPKSTTRFVIASIASLEDQACLQRTLAMPRWNIEFTRSLTTLSQAVSTGSSGVVITERRLMDGSSWKDVLATLDRHPNRPPPTASPTRRYGLRY
jgi:hypothetical protein